MGLVLLAAPAAAQEAGERFELGSDLYLAGETATLDAEGRDDAFMAGARVTLQAEITGTAHMAGRFVEVTAPVGGSLYAAAQRITIEATIAEDALLAAQRIEVDAPVQGDLRVMGSEIEIDAPVGDTLMVAGEIVELDAPVTGDVALMANEARFGPEARIGGRLILYEEEPGALAVPERVVPADRIERRDFDGRVEGATRALSKPKAKAQKDSPAQEPISFLLGVLVVAVLGAALAVLAPATMASMRAHVLRAPGQGLMTGFVTVSALLGGTFVLGATVIGLIAAPFLLIGAVLACVAGYVVGAYALGAWGLSLFGGGMPDSNGDRAIAAAIGALSAGLIGLIPFLGWLFVLALCLTGAGAVTQRLFRPRLFAGD
ncbi:hypothetical protein AVJ23_02315 [Pseudoponticoccus marisrubri]|uniref:DUF8173 domain-containing protein n=1 Tax=Pseudoponticoccus marisrubri TaxID=1685382 RepID=A0A0W7WQK6_9RHOB|nr:hypothetical protein AVJ23_02315 [Pseudoponticoccus marisrubri]